MINLTCTFWTKLNICRGWVYSSSNDKRKQHLDLALKRWLSKCGFKATKFLFFVSPYIYKYCTWSGIYMPTLVKLGSILTNEKFGNGATIVSIGHSTVFLSLGFSYVFLSKRFCIFYTLTSVSQCRIRLTVWLLNWTENASCGLFEGKPNLYSFWYK